MVKMKILKKNCQENDLISKHSNKKNRTRKLCDYFFFLFFDLRPTSREKIIQSFELVKAVQQVVVVVVVLTISNAKINYYLYEHQKKRIVFMNKVLTLLLFIDLSKSLDYNLYHFYYFFSFQARLIIEHSDEYKYINRLPSFYQDQIKY